MPETEIYTERLQLRALTLDQLHLVLDAPERLEQELGIPVSRDVVTARVRRAINMKIDKMSKVTVEQHPWYTYWLVVVSAVPFGAGLVGFKGCPDRLGEVEVGYGIDPAYGRRGYTTEAVRALIAWALEDETCRSVFAPVKKSNTPSNRVLAKAGMQVYEETDDTLFWRIEQKG